MPTTPSSPPANYFSDGTDRSNGQQSRPSAAPRPTAGASAPQAGKDTELTRDQKLRLQIMRVQLRLTTLGLYSGPLDGYMTAPTKQALTMFQDLKGLPKTGQMGTTTLNALGVSAAN